MKTIGMERVAFSVAETTELVETRNHVRLEGNQFLGHGEHTFLALTGEAVVEANVASIGPAKLL